MQVPMQANTEALEEESEKNNAAAKELQEEPKEPQSEKNNAAADLYIQFTLMIG